MTETSPNHQRWNNLFKLLDASKNDLIGAGDVPFIEKSLRTYSSGKFTEAQITAIVAAFSDVISELTAAKGGGDKKVSRSELLALADKWAGLPFSSAPAWYKRAVAAVFTAIDTNKNGEISESEAVALGTGMIAEVTENDIKAAYATLEGTLTKESAQKATWQWLNSTETQAQDLVLAIIVTKYAP